MSELDDRLRLLREQCRAWASELRPHALALDHDPETISRLIELPAVRWSARLQLPATHNPRPLVLDGHSFFLTTATERVVFCEEMARGDLGMMLALPGGSMSGVLVGAVGDPSQQEWFYGRLLERPTWTFFALTEPDGGSDASTMQTTGARASSGPVVLTGAKRYVSNALRAAFGVVFYRTGTGPLGVQAAIVDGAAPGLRVEPIETIGVRGAQLGAITLDRVEVPPDRVLGRHLPAAQRGARGWLRTFNLLRPTVASMGVGVAQSALDYVHEHRRALAPPERDRLARLDRRVESVRRLTRAAAAAVDRDADAGHLASAAKERAARLAEHVTRQALTFFGTGARLAHPLLDKLARDALALELMEGTGNIQRLAVFQAAVRGTLDVADVGPCSAPT